MGLNQQTIGYTLSVDEKYYKSLDIESFSRMMSNPSYCYKFYWLEAIVNLINDGISETTLGDIFDEMIANAWYSVLEYHIHLTGKVRGEYKDSLENAVINLHDASQLRVNADRIQIKNAIKQYESAIEAQKNKLTEQVPKKALTGFMGSKVTDNAYDRLLPYMLKFNQTNTLPYIFGETDGIAREVYFQHEWIEMIKENTQIILGWVQYEKAKWLQKVNPEVPGIIYKLALVKPTRNLRMVHNLWDAIIDVPGVVVADVFTGEQIQREKYDVDHFIPWSFVMHNELWNLMPMDSSLNSTKNNRLPRWDEFFDGFAQNQFLMYRMIHEYDKIHDVFLDCNKDYLHSLWAEQELYRKGNSKEEFYSILEKNMHPVYDSAKRQGYQLWQM